MRRLTRTDLPTPTADELSARQQSVNNASDQRAESDRLWTGSGRLFDDLRRNLAGMGSGRQRCMYCEDGVGTDIDHFWPRSAYPRKTFEWENHLLACADCNRRKGIAFPLEDGVPILLDPSADEPRDHIILTPSLGRYVSVSDRGARSIDVYKLNRDYLIKGRRDARVALQALIATFAARRRSGEDLSGDELRTVIQRYGFSSVLEEILFAARTEEGRAWLDPGCVSAIDEYPEVEQWL